MFRKIFLIFFIIISSHTIYGQSQLELFKKVNSLVESEKYEEAERYLAQYIKLNSNDDLIFMIWELKGGTLIKLKRYEEALSCFDNSIKIRSDFEPAWTAKAEAYDSLGKFEDAINCLDSALSKKPGDISNLIYKGFVLQKVKKFTDAIKCFEEALKIGPDNYNDWYDLAYSFKKLGLYKEAIICYDGFNNEFPSLVTGWKGKAECYALLNNKQEMINALKKAIDIDMQCIKDIKLKSEFKEYLNDPDFLELVK